MNDEQLIDNLLTFYLAGHETTSKALTWTLYLLACSPPWTEALTQEIAKVTGGKPVSSDHIDKLVLTQQVIKESMRLYPAGPHDEQASHWGRQARRTLDQGGDIDCHTNLCHASPSEALAPPECVRPDALLARE